MVYSNGRTQTFTGNELPIAKWMFRDGGKCIAFEQETVHGGQGINYELWDLPSNRRIDVYAPQYDRDGQLVPNQHGPQWVQALDASGHL